YAFTVCNSTLDAVLSDMFGKSTTAIQNYLFETDAVDLAYCASLLQRTAKKKATEVIAAIEGFNMSSERN
ncbi:MAG: IS110 family transposase, partial [Clostridia bacterium]